MGHSYPCNNICNVSSFLAVPVFDRQLTCGSVLASLLAFFIVYLRRLIPHNDIQRIVASWGNAGTSTQAESQWPTDFSRDIIPIPCHSHNDYWRHVPLYDALAAGCTSVEADIWLTGSDLLVGHTLSSLQEIRSLKSLYIDPISSILAHQNPSTSFNNNATQRNGVFDTNTTVPLILLIDMKTDGLSTFPVLLDHLEPLRSGGWVTYFNGTNVVPGLITVVGSGNTPFDFLISNTTYRDVFFDAPLDLLWGENAPSNSTQYTDHNSYYASVSFEKAIGKPWHGTMTPQQMRNIQGQIKGTKSKGLKARYWNTPSWPVGLRDHVWNLLEKEDVGILNVDDLEAAAKRNWGP